MPPNSEAWRIHEIIHKEILPMQYVALQAKACIQIIESIATVFPQGNVARIENENLTGCMRPASAHLSLTVCQTPPSGGRTFRFYFLVLVIRRIVIVSELIVIFRRFIGLRFGLIRIALGLSLWIARCTSENTNRME